MKIWFDTEFIEDGRTIDLISIGAVREDGLEYYAENAECDLSRASPWVKENVLLHLRPGYRKSRAQIARDLVAFAGAAPEFWAYYADYDWVALCQLYGTMMDLPQGWPMLCLDVQQVRHLLGIKEIPIPQTDEHDALADARWTARAWSFVTTTPEPAGTAGIPEQKG